jgi:hypothetical protein
MRIILKPKRWWICPLRQKRFAPSKTPVHQTESSVRQSPLQETESKASEQSSLDKDVETNPVQDGSTEESDPDEYHDPREYFLDEGNRGDTYDPGWALKKGDTFIQSSHYRDFVVNGPPIGEIVRLQEYSDEEARDRAFCVAASSVSTVHDLLRRFARSRSEASFYLGRVKHY